MTGLARCSPRGVVGSSFSLCRDFWRGEAGKSECTVKGRKAGRKVGRTEKKEEERKRLTNDVKDTINNDQRRAIGWATRDVFMRRGWEQEVDLC